QLPASGREILEPEAPVRVREHGGAAGRLAALRGHVRADDGRPVRTVEPAGELGGGSLARDRDPERECEDRQPAAPRERAHHPPSPSAAISISTTIGSKTWCCATPRCSVRPAGPS